MILIISMIRTIYIYDYVIWSMPLLEEVGQQIIEILNKQQTTLDSHSERLNNIESRLDNIESVMKQILVKLNE